MQVVIERNYKKPQTQILPLTKAATKYLTQERKISKESLEHYQIGCNSRNEIVIPFFDEEGELVLVKRRGEKGEPLQRERFDEKTQKYVKYECKTDCESDGKGMLFGTAQCDIHLSDNLIICFGEYDALSCHSDGLDNVVSLPYGDRALGFIELQWDFLEQFKEIIIYPDKAKDKKEQLIIDKKIEELAQRLDKARCKLVRDIDRHGTKDANELLQLKGQGFNRAAVENAKFIPEPGLIFLADYVAKPRIEGTPMGWRELDKSTGGLATSNLSEWGGDNNAGKTTGVLNVIVNLIKEGQKVFFWSGEQAPDRIRNWIEQIIAGPDFVVDRYSEKTGRTYYFADPKYVELIRNWYRDKLIIFDRRGIESEEFFKMLEVAVRRHDFTHAFIDNLMAFASGSDDYYSAQASFVQSCKNFADDWDRHLGLIVHNKIIEKGKIPDKDDVEGKKLITNWADQVFQFYRIMNYRKAEWGHAKAIISLCKNRDAEHFTDVRMDFEPTSKRLFQIDDEVSDYRVGWETEEILDLLNNKREKERKELRY